jgi:hypothetical protein
MDTCKRKWKETQLKCMIKNTQLGQLQEVSVSEQEQLQTGLNKGCTSAGVDKFSNKLRVTSKHQASGR